MRFIKAIMIMISFIVLIAFIIPVIILVIIVIRRKRKNIKKLNDVLIDYVWDGDFDGVQQTISQGAEITAEVLYVAATRGYIDIVRFIVESGVDLDAKHNGSTSLISASNSGHFIVVKYLVENGCDINLETNSGDTALICATREGNLDIVEYLISKGAYINDNDKKMIFNNSEII